jgi:polypeptide N-acetylgalactosaminyltransferase
MWCVVVNKQFFIFASQHCFNTVSIYLFFNSIPNIFIKLCLVKMKSTCNRRVQLLLISLILIYCFYVLLDFFVFELRRSKDLKKGILVLPQKITILYEKNTEEPDRKGFRILNTDVLTNQLEKSMKHEIDHTNPYYHGLVGRDSVTGTKLWKETPYPDFNKSFEENVAAHKGYAFNSRKSDSIPLDRDFPNFLSKECTSKNYANDLPRASVIIIFHNELLSVLLRSIHSVLNYSPPSLLEEILLVEDKSNKTSHPWLFDTLDTYVKNLPKTRVYHLSERHGLMGARVYGAKKAIAPVLVFLDSHIEASRQWLEPLLESIQENNKTIVTPLIHVIDDQNFNIISDNLSVISFTWSLGQKSLDTILKSTPINSPILAGGLFAIQQDWFENIGYYDNELRYYGGEEMELGFKAWMCGGRVIVHPCSRVAHVFRSSNYWSEQVYFVSGDEIKRNKLRVAHVWMDEYAKLVEKLIGPSPLPLGSLTKAFSIREKLKCHSFKWFLKNVATDVMDPIEKNITFSGSIENVPAQSCLDTMQSTHNQEYVKLFPCHRQGSTQFFLWDAEGNIRPYENLNLCIKVEDPNYPLVEYSSECGEKTQWIFDPKTQQIKHKLFSDHCLQVQYATDKNNYMHMTLTECTINKFQQFKLFDIWQE